MPAGVHPLGSTWWWLRGTQLSTTSALSPGLTCLLFTGRMIDYSWPASQPSFLTMAKMEPVLKRQLHIVSLSIRCWRRMVPVVRWWASWTGPWTTPAILCYATWWSCLNNMGGRGEGAAVFRQRTFIVLQILGLNYDMFKSCLNSFIKLSADFCTFSAFFCTF